MSRRLVNLSATGVLLAFLATAAVATAAPTAAPTSGGEHVSFALTNNGDEPLFLLDSPFGSPSPSFLPSAGCSFAPLRNGAALTADVRGWEGPILVPELGTREVALHATVHGTVSDTRGNTYHVAGSFQESGTTLFPDFEVPFQGSGQLTIAGPSGVVSGKATFVDVASRPPEWDFYFDDIQVCTIR
jgi:hypothetical protein